MNFNISNFSNLRLGFTGNAPAKTQNNDEQKTQSKKPIGQPEKDELVKSNSSTEQPTDTAAKPRKSKKREKKELKKKAAKKEIPTLTPDKIEELKKSKNVPEEVKTEILALPLNDPDAFNRGVQEIVEKHNDKI